MNTTYAQSQTVEDEDLDRLEIEATFAGLRINGERKAVATWRISQVYLADAMRVVLFAGTQLLAGAVYVNDSGNQEQIQIGFLTYEHLAIDRDQESKLQLMAENISQLLVTTDQLDLLMQRNVTLVLMPNR